jgi:subtilisin family serine protease
MAMKSRLTLTMLDDRITPAAIIAVLDTGINFHHSGFAGRIYQNTRELADGKDNDGNGLVDDLHGWDFANGDNLPQDENGHGTHVAGLAIGAGGKVLPVQVLDRNASGRIDSIIKGIRYAVDMGAKVLNLSFGGVFIPSTELWQALQYTQARGVLVVVAAGNSRINIDQANYYPAAFSRYFPNVVTVAGLDGAGLWANSNYGNSVTIAAPAKRVKSFGLTSYYSTYSGTSQAAPQVAAVLAGIWAKKPSWTWQQVKIQLLVSADTQRLVGLVAGGKVLNFARSLRGVV